MKIFTAVLLMIGICYCLISADGKRNVFDHDDDVGNSNDYLDEVLRNLRRERSIVSKLEPLNIRDVIESNFEIKNGRITGLFSLYRHGDCTLDYNDEIVKVSTQLAERDVEVNVEYAARVFLSWIRGHATVKVDDLAVGMDISGKDGNAELDSFKVIHFGNYKIKKITGMAVVHNWLLKLITNEVEKNSRAEIVDALENRVASEVVDVLDEYQLPKLSGEDFV